ncbi:MAG: GNAT family N-acetyltransferase [Bacteroidales bacterium]|nr:GNAT family N-acetyltransferase [Clostridium sp.]MCM1204485.1 GNAT family N-acetyltransferase [Bacteroidales bacterium]
MSFLLNTNRLILKIEDQTKAADVLEFYEKNKALFERFEPTRPEQFYTLAYQTATLHCEYTQFVKGKALRYYVYLKTQPEIIIGSVNFSRLEHGPFSRASIGYKFDAAYHGHGYAWEACQAAIPIMFSQYRIHRLEARVATDNVASIRLLERLGFLFEGIEYQSVEVNGVFRDHFRYSLIADPKSLL